jgi:molecular chaperone GrpE
MEMESQAAAENAAAPPNTNTKQYADELAAAQELAEENRRKWLYAMAELDNVRKRLEKQLIERLTGGRKEILGKFLPVIDNLQRALGFDITSDSLREGLQATLRGFEAVLASEQVRPIQILGRPFDPRLAEAIGTRETNDVAENIVLDEAQRGYMIGEELLRPAQVIVSIPPSNTSHDGKIA